MVKMYTTHFNIKNLCILPTHFIHVFCVILRINSDYSLNGNWRVFVIDIQCTFCEAENGFLVLLWLILSLKMLKGTQTFYDFR
jgi:hypothetical protein